jgi:hypothetical protein
MTAVPPLFARLNLKEQPSIIVIDAPSSFERELSMLEGVEVMRSTDDSTQATFAIVFATTQAQVDRVAVTDSGKRKAAKSKKS